MLDLSERARQYYGSQSREPVFVVRIDLDGTDVNALYITSRANTVTDLPGSNVFDGFLAELSEVTSEIFPEEARVTIGSAGFDVIDSARAFSDYLELLLESGISIQNKKAEFYLGFAGWKWDDLSLYSTLRVAGVTYTDGRYRIESADLNRFLRRQIFEPKKTVLAASIDEDSDTIPVLSTADFQAVRHNAGFSEDPAGDWVYIRIDDEVIACPEADILPAAFTNVRRGAFGTRPQAVKVTGTDFDRGKSVAEYIYLEGNAIDLAYALQHGEFISDTAVTLPAHWHAGIDRDDIKRSDFVEIGADIFDELNPADGLQLRLFNLKRADAKQFIEREIYRPVGVFSPIRRNGRIGLQRLTPIITEATPVLTVDADLVASYSPVRYLMNQVRNIVSVDWNRHPVKDVYTRATQVIDSDSVSQIQDAKEVRVQFQGIASNRQTDQAVQSIIDKYRDRLGSPPIRMDVTCLYFAATLELGDIVRVKIPYVRDYTSGATQSGAQIELDRTFEIRRSSVDHRTGRVTLSLGATSRTSRPLPIPELQPVVSDAWYSSQGTDLNTVMPIVIDGQGGFKTQPGSWNLTGSADGKQAIYYFADGDLTIDPGTVLTWDKTVSLHVRGFLQWDGVGSAAGDGRAGVGPPTGDFPLAIPDGVQGFVGNAVSSSGVESHRNPSVPGSQGVDSLARNTTTVGRYAAFPFLTALRWDEADQKLRGYFGNLAGTSGGPGDAAAATTWDAEPGTQDYIRQTVLGYKWGTAGGNSGGGLVVVCRGMEFGSAGSIDLSGDDSLAPTRFTSNNRDLYPGAGAAGGPGALCILLDGGGAVSPDLTGHLVANYGTTSVVGTPMPGPTVGQAFEQATPGLTGYSPGLISGVDLAQAASHVQYIPTNATAGVGDDDRGPSTVPELVTSVRYNAAPASSPPLPPKGDGTNDGWSDTPIIGGQWMATKTNVDDTAGAWSPSTYITAVPTADVSAPELHQVFAWNGADYELAYRMRWAGVWIGGTYEPGDVVTDGGFLAVANVRTEEKPAPVPAGPEGWLTGFGDAPAWTDLTFNAATITSGVRVRGQLGYAVTGARVWIAEVDGSTEYEVWIVTDPEGTPGTRLLRPRFVPGQIGWLDIATGTQIVPAGVTFDLLLIKYARGNSSSFQGDWAIQSSNQTPATGEANFANNGASVEIHHTANGGQDRQAQLESVPVGAAMEVEGQQWNVTSVTPNANSVGYTLTPAQTNPAPGVKTIRFEWGDAEPIEYVQVANHWAARPEITGLFGQESWPGAGIQVAEDQNAYGVDLYGYLLSTAENWSLLAATGADLAGGGSGGSAFDPTQSYNITGTWSFANPVTGVDPTADQHLATKAYADLAAFDPSADQTIAGNWQFDGQCRVQSPTLDSEAVNQGTLNAAIAVSESNQTQYIDNQDAATLASAQAYADQAEADANAYSDAGDAATLANARGYTDSELAAADLADVTRSDVAETITQQWTFDPATAVAGVMALDSWIVGKRTDNVSEKRIALRAEDGGGTGLDIFVLPVATPGFQLRPRWSGVTQDNLGITYIGPLGEWTCQGGWIFDEPITGQTPTADAHLATKGYVDANAGLAAGDNATITGDWQFDGQCIVQTPTLGAEAANLGTVEALIAVSEGNQTQYIDNQDAATLASANSYTDQAEADAKSYADTGDAATLSSANAYTDAEIAAQNLTDVTRSDVAETITAQWTFDAGSSVAGAIALDCWFAGKRTDNTTQRRLGLRLEDASASGLDFYVAPVSSPGFELVPRWSGVVQDLDSIVYTGPTGTYQAGGTWEFIGARAAKPANVQFKGVDDVQRWPAALNKNVDLNQATVTIDSENADTVIISNSGTATTVNLPAAGADLDSIGMSFDVLCSNTTGDVTINQPSGGTLVWHRGTSTGTGNRTLGNGGWARLVRRAANQWHIFGDGIS